MEWSWSYVLKDSQREADRENERKKNNTNTKKNIIKETLSHQKSNKTTVIQFGQLLW